MVYPWVVDSLARFLQLARREMNAQDARIEFGLNEPHDPKIIWCSLESQWRLAVIYDEAPETPYILRRRLEALARSFSEVTESVSESLPKPPPAPGSQRLDELLFLLAQSCDATSALVIDEHSPIIWGNSESPRGSDDLNTAIELSENWARCENADLDLAGLLASDEDETLRQLSKLSDPELRDHLARSLPRLRERGKRPDREAYRRHILAMRAAAAFRGGDAPLEGVWRDGELGSFNRGFGGIYRLLLIFEGDFSELKAAGSSLRALPVIEGLVASLPPIDPEPGGGRVLPLRPPL